MSRENNLDLEWKLDSEVFTLICKKIGEPDIDLFASRINFQLKPYVSWRPDPGSVAVNAFKLNWSMFRLPYLFSPFSVINKVLQKMKEEQAEGIMVMPLWTTQPWFPKMLRLICAPPFLLPHSNRLLVHPSTNQLHPLVPKLKLIVCRLSGKLSQTKAFQEMLPISFWLPGDNLLKNNIGVISKSGCVFVIGNKQIIFRHL
eukprot:GHVU01231418.1.p1 GENE.GHVU01231418.1~~GHVU01231418.1.p1  ORF type:complete len:201 (-),score=8.70 GHVU01231418.1:180-782(-)